MNLVSEPPPSPTINTSRGSGLNSKKAIMLRVYETSRSFGRAIRIELCTVSLPMCSVRTPDFSLI